MSQSSYPSPAAQAAQVLLRLQYQELARGGSGLPDFADVEFRCYSQHGEDGILLYLFSLLGATNRRVFEISAGDGLECNAANLVINHGWRGLLVDGDLDLVARGRSFYSTCRNTWVAPPTFAEAWVTAENVDALMAGHGFAAPIDLLSLDVDGNDYWVWKALESISPRVVVIEFNAACGPQESVTISYRPDYRLVGVQSMGINAFFIRNGVAEDLLPERSAQECFEGSGRLRDWTPAALDVMLAGTQAWVHV